METETITISALPTELVIEILDLAFPRSPTLDAYEDTSDTGRDIWRARSTSLISMQLVCRIWLHVARVLIWRDIYIRRGKSAKLMLNSPGYGHFETKSVTLMGWSMNNRDGVTNETAIEVLKGLKEVEELKLYEFGSGGEQPLVKRTVTNFGAASRSACHVVQDIWAVESLSSLKSLTLLSTEIPDASPIPLHSTFSLSNLSISVTKTSYATPFSYFIPACKSLTSLTLLFLSIETRPDLLTFLLSIGSSLHHLTWHRYCGLHEQNTPLTAFGALTSIKSLQLAGNLTMVAQLLLALPEPPTLKTLLVEQPGFDLQEGEVKLMESWLDGVLALEGLRRFEILKNGRRSTEWEKLKETKFGERFKEFERGLLK